MNVTVEKLSSNQVKINFVAESERLEKGMEKAYRKLAKRINIPGFRKGKAPRRVIEMQYGESVFYEDAFDDIFPEMFREAVDSNELFPVGQPTLCDGMKITTGEPLEFSVEVYVRPDVVLGMYKGVTAHKGEIDVTDDDVNAEIERERQRVARVIDVVDRPVERDDEVNIDYEGFIDGEPFEGGAAKAHKLNVGSGEFIPGFEEQLIGANIGDEVKVETVFPEDYHAENLKGKPVSFVVKVNTIKAKEIPELDDEFAKDVSEFSTFAEYKDDVRAKLLTRAEERVDAEFENEVIDAIVENATVDVPPPMVEREIDSILREMEIRLMYQGINFQTFLQITGQTVEELREAHGEDAARRVKTNLVIGEISKAEKIEAEDSEIDEEIESFAKQSGRTLEEYKEKITEDESEYIKNRIVVRKTVQFLTESAVPETLEAPDPVDEEE